MGNSTGGTLFLVGTPIGNLGDITLRAIETLKNVDLIAAEDTRQVQKLLNHFSIHKPLTSYFEHNKNTKGIQLLEELASGKNIALVSDAGMPGISDPGADIVKECINNNIKVVAIPGPSAVLTALVASGLDTDGFVFAGFFPRGKKERRLLLEGLAKERRTLIFYESPHRLLQALETILNIWGDRQCCVARELTKIYEEYQRGTISEVLAFYQNKVIKGEITLMISGLAQSVAQEAPSNEEVLDYYNSLLKTGLTKKEAVKATAESLGISKRELYNQVMV